jgi:hypothetical protein
MCRAATSPCSHCATAGYRPLPAHGPLAPPPDPNPIVASPATSASANPRSPFASTSPSYFTLVATPHSRALGGSPPHILDAEGPPPYLYDAGSPNRPIDLMEWHLHYLIKQCTITNSQ